MTRVKRRRGGEEASTTARMACGVYAEDVDIVPRTPSAATIMVVIIVLELFTASGLTVSEKMTEAMHMAERRAITQ